MTEDDVERTAIKLYLMHSHVIFEGETVPKWENLGPKIQHAWRTCASAALLAIVLGTRSAKLQP